MLAITPIRAKHRRAAAFRDQDQRLHRGLPFRRVVLLFGTEVMYSPASSEGVSLRPPATKIRFVERAGPGHPARRWLCADQSWSSEM